MDELSSHEKKGETEEKREKCRVPKVPETKIKIVLTLGLETDRL